MVTKGSDLKSEYKKLLKEIQTHNKLYYIDANPIISDYEYDLLIKKAEEIEKDHPDWVDKNSPTKTISTDTTGHFKSQEHKFAMMSLANTYSEEELTAFIIRVEKLTEVNQPVFHVELKMDGVALSVIYEGGNLFQAVTRGDGKKGDDVTENAFCIVNLPHKINCKERLELRGEVYLPLKEFQRLNEERSELGLDLYANPRNAASGSLKLIDPKESAKRGLHIMLYDIANHHKGINHQSEISPYLKTLNLPVLPSNLTHSGKNAFEILSFAKEVEKKRSTLDFEIDGIVVKVDDLSFRQILGATNKSPRWAVAYKFSPERAQTQIESISVQVGRTGVLTPVANLTPVLLAGSIISRATLHNQDEIDRKDIREKDYVIIEKGGDVIPKVVMVIEKKGHQRSSKWHIPNKCPKCKGEVIQKEGEVAIRCKSGAKCSGQYIASIKHFVSKGAMNIENFGIKIVERFYELGLINTLTDIYKIKAKDLEGLEGFKSRSIEVLLSCIEQSKNCELYRFIFALGIPFVGVVSAKVIAEYVKNIDEFLKVTEDELMKLDGIGQKLANSVVTYLSNHQNLDEIQNFLSLGINPKPMIQRQAGHQFFDKTFVITGTLEQYDRDEAKELIENLGGKVSSSLSKVTNYLLLGKNPGSKYNKALKLGVEILDEEKFKQLL